MQRVSLGEKTPVFDSRSNQMVASSPCRSHSTVMSPPVASNSGLRKSLPLRFLPVATTANSGVVVIWLLSCALLVVVSPASRALATSFFVCLPMVIL